MTKKGKGKKNKNKRPQPETVILSKSPTKADRAGSDSDSGADEVDRRDLQGGSYQPGHTPAKKRKMTGPRAHNQPTGKGRNYTLSLALPGSIVSNAQSPELRSYLAGQIARAICVFQVDEVVVFREGNKKDEQIEGEIKGARESDPNIFLARVLQYLETPQYLRKSLFPVHPDLKYAGLLNPLDAPHHARADEWIPYREGVVQDRPLKKGKGSYVNVGLLKNARIDQPLQPGVRVTVRMLDEGLDTPSKAYEGVAVAPSAPREEIGMYFGYQVRLAEGLGSVFSECPYEGGYDHCLGTSEHGVLINDEFHIPPYKHLLIVFGGLGGLEDSVDTDENLKVVEAKELFDQYVNVVPEQGSRTIRTEEAILIAVSALRPHILGSGGK